VRTFLFIVGGLAVLGGSLLVARWFGGAWPTTLAEVSKFFIPIWLCLSALNLLLGVKQAGYSIGEELPIFPLIFTIPAGAAAFLWWRSSG
jgi:hypothetical protein